MSLSRLSTGAQKVLILPKTLKILENLEVRWLMWASHRRREAVWVLVAAAPEARATHTFSRIINK